MVKRATLHLARMQLQLHRPNKPKEQAKPKSIRKPRNPNDLHHIVPKNHPGAKIARDVLKSHGIDVNTDPRNLVSISRNFHVHLNNHYYIEYVNRVMWQYRFNPIQGLNIIRNKILVNEKLHQWTIW